MAKHRNEDRIKGLTGQTDPAKIKAEMDRIRAQVQADADRSARESGR